MKLLPLHELTPGMQLAEDIYGKFDLLYASKGDILTEKLIEGIKRLGIQSICVAESDEGPGTLQEVFVPEPEPVAATGTPPEDALKEFAGLIESLKSQFLAFRLLNKEVLHKVWPPLQAMQTEVFSSPAVLKQLGKLQSVDGYTLQHSVQVSVLSALLGHWFGLSQKDQQALAYGGLLHDLGKLKIPIHILNKPSRLSPEEFEIIRKHAEHSFELVRGLPGINEEIRTAILQHHEKTDGSGYPGGLRGDEIHFYAQLICIADIYSAMTADKVYNRKLTPLKATEEVFSASFENKINAEAANLFLQQIYRMLVGTRVRLNNGMEGEIVYFNRFSPGKPLVKVGEDFIDLSREKFLFIEEIL